MRQWHRKLIIRISLLSKLTLLRVCWSSSMRKKKIWCVAMKIAQEKVSTAIRMKFRKSLRVKNKIQRNLKVRNNKRVVVVNLIQVLCYPLCLIILPLSLTIIIDPLQWTTTSQNQFTHTITKDRWPTTILINNPTNFLVKAIQLLMDHTLFSHPWSNLSSPCNLRRRNTQKKRKIETNDSRWTHKIFLSI